MLRRSVISHQVCKCVVREACAQVLSLLTEAIRPQCLSDGLEGPCLHRLAALLPSPRPRLPAIAMCRCLASHMPHCTKPACQSREKGQHPPLGCLHPNPTPHTLTHSQFHTLDPRPLALVTTPHLVRVACSSGGCDVGAAFEGAFHAAPLTRNLRPVAAGEAGMSSR